MKIKTMMMASIMGLTLTACGGSSSISEYAQIIQANEGKNDAVYDEKDASLKVVPLEQTKESLLGNIEEMFINDSIIGVVPTNKPKCVYLFDHDGKFKTKIDAQGNGPGEYKHLAKAFLFQNNIVILDIFGRKLLYYNLNGEFRKETKLDQVNELLQGRLLDESHIVTAKRDRNDPERATNTEIVITDLNHSITREFVPRPDKFTHDYDMSDYFAANQDGLFFIPLYSDRICKLTPDSCQTVFDFKLGDLMYSLNEATGLSRDERTQKYVHFWGLHITDDGTFVCATMLDKKIIGVCGNIHTGKLKTCKYGYTRLRGTYKNYFYLLKDGEINDLEGTQDNPSVVFIPSDKLLKV